MAMRIDQSWQQDLLTKIRISARWSAFTSSKYGLRFTIRSPSTATALLDRLALNGHHKAHDE
jgi:hypothetical protein